jgi:1-acyl-sn-glycerol-3-phosphate acyltransferase
MNTRPTRTLTRIYRVARLALHLLQGGLTLALAFPFLGPQWQARLKRRWARGLLTILNVQLSVRGESPDLSSQGVMFVANHVSWIDIYLLFAVRPARFIAKAEIRSWPVLGWFALKTGTLFIERGKRQDTFRINQQAAAALKAGDCVALFPEGTTSDGTRLGHFHASLLQPAVHTEATLWPMAIRFHHPDGSVNTAPAYVDNMSFGDSIRQVLREPVIHATITFAAPLPVQDKTRRELAHAAHRAISSQLFPANPCTTPEIPGDPATAAQTASRPTGSPYPAPQDSPSASAPVLTSGPR